MRIQHNIMAMNSYRNYNTNANALSKNLEKLSSGYRINRAGDDAAGLAISEKMRAQITGLDAAQKNVQDGISLVKTAEGAMQEVQDMLNRMVYLATQSANGTYDNEVDRNNLQKEVVALQDEINRIADSANFNGIKLLDGSLNDATTSTVEVTLPEATTGWLGQDKVAAPAQGKTVLHKDAVESSLTTFDVNLDNLSFDLADGEAASDEDLTLTIGAGTITIGKASITEDMDGAAIAEAAVSALETANAAGDGSAALKIGNATFVAEIVNGSTLRFTMTEKSAASITDVADLTGNFAVSAASTATKGKLNGSVNIATQVVKEGTLNAGEVLANTTSADDLEAADITDGAAIKVGDTTYVLAMSKETLDTNYGDGFVKVDLTDISEEGDDGYALKADVADVTDNLSEALTRITVAAKDNEMFSVGVDDDNYLTFQEKSSYAGDADLTSLEGIEKEIQFFASSSAVTNTTEATGTALTLQIGDTSDPYNQLKVSIQDIHVDALGIGDIDISSQAGAQAAVDKIKTAINSVSSTRGDLGAIQNRLEHTANNLSVMEENIQNAESAIRDTDIADEMTAYTKNNILLQSAQAMLAQANQVPQGVLQLLG